MTPNSSRAVTPSDKIRALIRDARRKQEHRADYLDVLGQVGETVAPALAAIRIAERNEDVHSEFMLLFVEWLPEVLAELLTRTAVNRPDELDLKELEKAIARRVFRLLERALRLSVAAETSAYEAENLTRYLPALLRLATLIETQNERGSDDD